MNAKGQVLNARKKRGRAERGSNALSLAECRQCHEAFLTGNRGAAKYCPGCRSKRESAAAARRKQSNREREAALRARLQADLAACPRPKHEEIQGPPRNIFEAAALFDDDLFTPAGLAEPTLTPAGTVSRVEVYAARVRAGKEIWHPEDRSPWEQQSCRRA